MVEDDGIAKFPNGEAEEQSEGERVKFCRGEIFHLPASELQLQQADFQRQRFLHVGVKEPLRLIEHV